jgi:transcriptional regulator with XRE-family HTH domain
MTPAKRSSGAPPRPYAAEAGWRTWLVDLGRQVRRVREFLGLSQDQLARLAGVSQGAVSRFEGGRGLQTPFLTILRIHLVLANGLRRLDPELLTDDARRLLRYMELFPVASETAEAGGPGDPPAVALIPDADLEALIRRYRTLPEGRRRVVLRALEALVAALARD